MNRPQPSGGAGLPTWGPKARSAQAAAGASRCVSRDRQEVRLQGAVIDLDNRLCFVRGRVSTDHAILLAGAGHSVPVCCNLGSAWF